MAAPLWLREEAWLRELLGWFLDKLEGPRARAITRRAKPSTVPALFQFHEDTQYRWELIEKLATEHSVFSIVYDRNIAAFDQPYENAQLRLNPDAEDLLRDWLDRPRIDPAQQAWERAVAPHRQRFADNGASLLAARPVAAGYEADALAAAFAAIGDHLEGELTLREIAARCFRGDSKFLDQRQELLLKLHGERAAAILPRPLLLTAWAPPDFTQLLVVENQDSFLRLAAHPPPGFALLYSGGFRASAGRLGSEHTRFAFLPGSDSAAFREQWLSEQLPVSFWGDLDFAGLGILKALRQSLPGLRAWEPGYRPMLALLEQGGGHRPEQAGKSGQTDPAETGCVFCDRTLLPALRRHGRFVDQEAVAPD
ncbi:Wadjet anti-phage system protein JetD domain-containing protein [Parahaliea mediterranea]|uniref:Wadjet protein JetD C-terminal domain-containing protein n=1 Tax=Parahaliea mediterranea TaxID=651086 RepID=A0A939DEN9_9GAMM|nr:Wadjet anti-phage system protein JetD domain-containing protein [Parahaliea mediterranea]MBN7796753.1 hypothetical protein [Parahaliea mediterranea]